MRYGERIAGFEGLHRFGATKNYHVADQNGRAYFCGCFKSIWVTTVSHGRRRKNPSSMKMLKDSKKSYNEQWHRQYRFERNLDRIMESRLARSRVQENDGKWNAVGNMQLLTDTQGWLEWRF